MQKSRLTVYYNGALWIGVYERIADGRLAACKITFGAEPKDYEVYCFLQQNWKKLRFSPSVDIEKKAESRINPKRIALSKNSLRLTEPVLNPSRLSSSRRKKIRLFIRRKAVCRKRTKSNVNLNGNSRKRKRNTGADELPLCFSFFFNL